MHKDTCVLNALNIDIANSMTSKILDISLSIKLVTK